MRSSSGGIEICVLLSVVFIALKLCGVVLDETKSYLIIMLIILLWVGGWLLFGLFGRR